MYMTLVQLQAPTRLADLTAPATVGVVYYAYYTTTSESSPNTYPATQTRGPIIPVHVPGLWADPWLTGVDAGVV